MNIKFFSVCRYYHCCIIILCAISVIDAAPNNGSNSGKTPAYIVVLLPFSGSYLFGKDKMEPAIDYAMTSVRRYMPPELSYFDFIVTYRNTSCSYRAGVAAAEFYYDKCVKDEITKERYLKTPLLFLGPVCNAATAVVASFANAWNVPVITTGAHAAWVIVNDNYTTLTRMTASYADVAYFIRGIFGHFQYGIYSPIHLVYEDVSYGSSTERECHYLMQSIYAVFTNHDIVLDVIMPYVITKDVHPDLFVEKLGNPKVVLMCASSEVVRNVMIAAKKAGLASPNIHDWYVVDLHNDSHYAHGAWKRGDRFDLQAKSAYRALHVVTLRTSQSKKFLNFSNYLKKEYEKRGVPSNERKVNGYAESFHDAIKLYIKSLSMTIKQGRDPLDGRAISQNMQNITFEGIGGMVSLDEYRDRLGDYSLLGMKDIQSGKFEVL